MFFQFQTVFLKSYVQIWLPFPLGVASTFAKALPSVIKSVSRNCHKGWTHYFLHGAIRTLSDSYQRTFTAAMYKCYVFTYTGYIIFHLLYTLCSTRAWSSFNDLLGILCKACFSVGRNINYFTLLLITDTSFFSV